MEPSVLGRGRMLLAKETVHPMTSISCGCPQKKGDPDDCGYEIAGFESLCECECHNKWELPHIHEGRADRPGKSLCGQRIGLGVDWSYQSVSHWYLSAIQKTIVGLCPDCLECIVEAINWHKSQPRM